ncbi:hypothetical protein RhiirA4_454404 [Rhizophagus irregularis]|uniref:Uncharacterized protein n=1 Tax=Rhizophagus irregularis TaxID=588596 RepID=A0A2I1G2S1_9GLOM|nr:hypothetical protein RhiirA4_454404 [Rhizophagus irregularis]
MDGYIMLYNDVIPRYFKNLPEPVNSDVTKTTLHLECFDCQLDELDLDEINQDKENNTE